MEIAHNELAAAGKVAIAALMAADVPAQADFSLDALPQAAGPLLTRPKFWHLLGASLCAFVCTKIGYKQPQVITFVRKANGLCSSDQRLGQYLRGFRAD